MEIIALTKRSGTAQNARLADKYSVFENLISALRKKIIPAAIIETINQEISLINTFSGSDQVLLKQLGASQNLILKMLEKELKMVPMNHYRNLWMSLGMAVYGLPLGVVFGLTLGNMAYLAIGLPIGLAIGTGVGNSLDKKVLAQGKQLDIEIK